MDFLRNGCRWVPQRYVLCLNIVIGLALCYMTRNCVSLVLPEMTYKILDIGGNQHGYCPSASNTSKVGSSPYAEFHWNEDLQQQIIAVFFVAYLITHVPGGILADMFGGKHVFGSGVILSSAVCLIIPPMARLGPLGFIFCRILQGLSQGVMFPSMSALLARWGPPTELATMVGITNTGIMVGMAICNLMTGFILQNVPGWDPPFYIYGGLGIVWWIIWVFVCYSNPDTHPFITEEEREFLKTSIKIHKKRPPVPVLEIIKCKPFWALAAINFAHDWAIYTMVSELAIYLTNVLHFRIDESGAVASLPYLATWVSGMGTGFLSDWIQKNNYMTLTNNRKMFSVISNISPIPFLMAASFSGCSHFWASFFFVWMMFFKGIAYASMRVNNIDLSTNFSGLLMAVVNGIGCFSGFLSPQIVGIVLTGEGSIGEWRLIFSICSLVLLVFSIPYIYFGSSERQPWDFVEMRPSGEFDQSTEQDANRENR